MRIVSIRVARVGVQFGGALRGVGGQAVGHFLPCLQNRLVDIGVGGVRANPMEVIAPLDLPRNKRGNAPEPGMPHALLIGVVVDVLVCRQCRERMPTKNKLQFL